MMAGMVAGMMTAWLHVKLGILHLLAGILMMTASVSRLIKNYECPKPAATGQPTVFTPLIDGGNDSGVRVAVIAGVVLVVKSWLWIGFYHRNGSVNACDRFKICVWHKLRGINTPWIIILGMAISNGLIALSGALFVRPKIC